MNFEFRLTLRRIDWNKSKLFSCIVYFKNKKEKKRRKEKKCLKWDLVFKTSEILFLNHKRLVHTFHTLTSCSKTTRTANCKLWWSLLIPTLIDCRNLLRYGTTVQSSSIPDLKTIPNPNKSLICSWPDFFRLSSSHWRNLPVSGILGFTVIAFLSAWSHHLLQCARWVVIFFPSSLCDNLLHLHCEDETSVEQGKRRWISILIGCSAPRTHRYLPTAGLVDCFRRYESSPSTLHPGFDLLCIYRTDSSRPWFIPPALSGVPYVSLSEHIAAYLGLLSRESSRALLSVSVTLIMSRPSRFWCFMKPCLCGAERGQMLVLTRATGETETIFCSLRVTFSFLWPFGEQRSLTAQSAAVVQRRAGIGFGDILFWWQRAGPRRFWRTFLSRISWNNFDLLTPHQ